MGYFVEYGPNSTRLQSSSDSSVFFEQILKEAKMKRSQLSNVFQVKVQIKSKVTIVPPS